MKLTKFRGSQTEKCLLTAFAGESQARNRYTYFSSRARQEGYIQIADIFEETANHERQHAERFFKFLNGGEVKVEWSFPAGIVGTTYENLVAAAAGERYEHSEMYPGFAGVARQEGFARVAETLEAICVAERQHEKRYQTLAENIRGGRVFSRQEEVFWRCRNCGYLHQAKQAPEVCPACVYPQAYFELHGENW
jgi:rubrerythrin